MTATFGDPNVPPRTRADYLRMNACSCGAMPGEACFAANGTGRIKGHHDARTKLARMLPATGRGGVMNHGRIYTDAWTTPRGNLVSTAPCEHCDGDSRWVRIDLDLRGHVCPICDWVLDDFDAENETNADEADSGHCLVDPVL